MYAKAGELGLPVSHMPFKGLLLHADDIEALLRDYPATTAVIDHCGFCKAAPGGPDPATSHEWQRLLGLAKYPQVCVCVQLPGTACCPSQLPRAAWRLGSCGQHTAVPCVHTGTPAATQHAVHVHTAPR
jgi:hypothetical protein